ncbi:MAG: hypothetical protein KC468_05115, partial [Myxococcales bacterium]|nr:hypothetical protein [Myxococcales bacterium]
MDLDELSAPASSRAWPAAAAGELDEAALRLVASTVTSGSGRARVLFLAANPADTGRLALERELREIKAVVRQSALRDRLELFSEWAVRPGDLQEHLLRYRPALVHFSGHGGGVAVGRARAGSRDL